MTSKQEKEILEYRMKRFRQGKVMSVGYYGLHYNEKTHTIELEETYRKRMRKIKNNNFNCFEAK